MIGVFNYYGKNVYMISGDRILTNDREFLHHLDGRYLRNKNATVEYMIDEDRISDSTGRVLYTVKEEMVSLPDGSEVYKIKGSTVEDFAGRIVLKASEHLERRLLYALLAIQG